MDYQEDNKSSTAGQSRLAAISHKHDTGHGDHGSSSTATTGTSQDDVIDIRNQGVSQAHGFGGHDTLYGALYGSLTSGGQGDDILYGYGHGDSNPARYQTHMMGDAGNDTLILDLSRQSTDNYDFRFGHHVFSGTGHDKFVFLHADSSDQRIVGRLDDFDPSRDEIWIDGKKLDLDAPSANARFVVHQGQQWLLINERALYALNAPRYRSETIAANGRNGSANEEDHFIDWPTAWKNGVPKSATINYVDPVNFVPEKYVPSQFIDYNTSIVLHGRMIHGTAAADSMLGGQNENNHIMGMGGDDYVWANRGHDSIEGGEGNDIIDGDMGNDAVRGGNGNDIIDGGKGHDHILGDNGNDVMAGGNDDDTILGGNGHDTIFGGTEQDELHGQAGNDRLYGSFGSDRLFGGSGNDQLVGQAGDDVLHGGLGNDTVNGGGGNDRLHAGPGHDRVNGQSGQDTLHGGQGSDTLFGMSGNDKLNGGAGNDTLIGHAGRDTLWGAGGQDNLHGGAGDDRLIGGHGADQLSGGVGADVFVFRSIAESLSGKGRDHILDFGIGRDRLDLRAIDADTDQRGNQQFSFSVDGPRENAVWLVTKGDDVIIRGDTDGNRRADFEIYLEDVGDMSVSDFLL